MSTPEHPLPGAEARPGERTSTRRAPEFHPPRSECRLCGGEGAYWWPFDQAVGGIEVARLCPECWPPAVPS